VDVWPAARFDFWGGEDLFFAIVYLHQVRYVVPPIADKGFIDIRRRRKKILEPKPWKPSCFDPH